MKNTLLCLSLLCIPALLCSIGDPARQEARIQAVYDEYNLSGQGVIIAILDRGIDYSHPAFLNPDGTSRVAYIYDMVNDAGANDNPYGIGTIFDQAAINASLLDGNPLLSNDLGGHGTATNSIAAGNGAGAAPGLDARGVAYNATIISVKLIQDPFPAGNGMPGQAGFFDAGYIDEALQFVSDKANEMGMPVVALMNFGSIGGPTDGTSAVCRAMDDFTAAGHLLVCGVGDDGGGDNSAAGTVMAGETVDLTINKVVAGNLRMDLYYPDDAPLNVSVITPSGSSFGPFNGPPSPNSLTNHLETDFNLFHRGSAVDFFGATSPRHQLLVDLMGPPGTYTIQLSAGATGNISFQASLNPSTFANNNGFTSFVRPDHSINDYSAAFSVISPTDYVVDNTWIDINGNARGISGQGDAGEIWLGSSKGPTNDGRLGIDFAAPGEVLYAAYSPGSFYSRFPANTLQNSNALYGIQNAVSAAAPLTTGVIALLLELKPDLTQAEALEFLQNSARQDAFTGPVPNNCWGHGKLDAKAAADLVFNVVGTEEPSAPTQLVIAPNPVEESLRIALPNNTQPAARGSLSLYAASGVKLQSFMEADLQQGTLPIGDLPPGVYILSGEINGEAVLGRFVKR